MRVVRQIGQFIKFIQNEPFFVNQQILLSFACDIWNVQ